MTPGELRTAHDALGVSTEFIAAKVGCHVNMIWRYEHPSRTADVPDHVAEVMRDLLNDFDCAAERIAEEVADDEAVPRMVAEEDRDRHAPEIAGWGPTAYGLLIADVQRRTERPVEYVR